MAIKDVEKKLGYCFTNISLLELALTHKSSNNSSNNERLEYLGDSILNGVISEYLFLKFPNEKEGKLTRMRSFLVKGETLTKKANELGLIKYIKLSKGTANLSENRKYSILEGSIESLIGAVFLDNGWDKAKLFIMEIFCKELSELGSDQEFRDSKTELQELLQSKKLKLPKYISKESHNGFDCEVVLNKNIYTATGNSKRQAEIAAAKKALIHLKSENA
jgi:ribonuclease-3